MKVFLVEMETGVRIRDWVELGVLCDSVVHNCDSLTIDCAAAAGLATRTLDADMFVVTKVTENGTALTEAASAAAVTTTPSSWFYTLTTRELRVHLASDASTASSVVMMAVVLETLARGATVTKARSTGTALTWDGRVAGLPSISQRITPDELGAGSVITLGALTIDNRDGLYDRLLNERIVSGLEMRVLLGDDAAAYSTFRPWLKALMQEPEAGADRVTIPLLSIAVRLNQPAITDEFTLAAYPAMDANITGFNMPKVWGTVVGAEAFRIASGRWKWSNRAVTSITTVKDEVGATIATTGTDHALGEFTVDASHDTKARLYVDGRGVALDFPGELIADVVQTLGAALTAADLDLAALAELDDARAVSVGFQVRTGSVKDVLDLIARSAFVDYFVDRENILSARVRQRDQGNYVTNDDFEVDAAGWTGTTGATLSRTTSYRFRGAASLQIVKAAGSPLAHARAAMPLQTAALYVVTLLAAVTSGSTTAFRVALSGSVDDYLSPAVTLSATEWTRVTFTTAVPVTASVFLCDSLTLNCDTLLFDCDTAGWELHVYPQYNGGSNVTVVLDDVEVVEALVLDDTNTEVLGATPTDPTLWRVRAGYQFDGRLQTRRFANGEDSTTHRLYATAESREIPGYLVTEADGAVVADAALDYYRSGRTRVSLRFLDLDTLVSVSGDEVIYLNTTRRPTVPGNGRLFRLVGMNEERPENGTPELRLEAEALYDPIFDQMTITAA